MTTRVERAERAGSRTWTEWALLVVLVLVGTNAVYGGIGLLVDGMGMPDDWLDRLSVDTWTWPGVALLTTVALPQLGAAWLVWRHHDRAAVVSVVVGAGLVVWIGVQLALLQRYFVLQPVIAALGLVEVGLALGWRHAAERAGTR